MVSPESEPRPERVHALEKAQTSSRGIAIAVAAFLICAPLTFAVFDTGLPEMVAKALAAQGPNNDASATMPPTSIGKWVVRPPTGMESKKVNAVAVLDASSGSNFLGQAVTMSVWCDFIKPNFKLQYRDYLGSDQGIDGFKTVILQVDNGAVEEFRMTVGPDQTTLLLDGRSPGLISSFLREGRFRIYTAPYNAEPIQATFDLAGAKAVLQPIIDNCTPTKP